ncbi:FAD-dependent monooxygenase [Nonomuraea sp. H19]|uniref:FAD-dependent monooxygenase n=1 Tax=Nonomuraea sp. H19 TaxID=3452206 RepID=UPI003F89A9E8
MNVVVAGGGPAGMMLSLLLARAGIEVTVLEKHRDFLRDFRGDTVHPSTLEALDQLGLSERFHQLDHRKVTRLNVPLGGGLAPIEAFAGMKVKFPYIAFVPQWDFLNLIPEEAQRYPGFTLKMRAEVVDLLPEGGVRYRDRDGEHELRADLTVACDGRDSLLRARAGLPVRNIGAPFDVAWFRLPRRDPEVEEFYDRVAPYKWIVGFDRRTYIQLAYVFDKNRREKLITDGIGGFRDGVARAVPEIADRVALLRFLQGGRELPRRAGQQGHQVVRQGPAADRRRRSCDVPDGRCGRQLRHPGRGRSRQHPLRRAQERRAGAGAPAACRTEKARAARGGDAAAAGRARAERRGRERAQDGHPDAARPSGAPGLDAAACSRTQKREHSMNVVIAEQRP